jgi:hypothetical protein
MALEDIFKGVDLEKFGFEGGVPGLAVGVGAALLAPIVLPLVAQVGKPLTKAAIKEGLLMYEKSKEALAEVTEVFEDIVAEAKAELAQDQKDAKSQDENNQPELIVVTD